MIAAWPTKIGNGFFGECSTLIFGREQKIGGSRRHRMQ
jgi:hypothetical protein